MSSRAGVLAGAVVVNTRPLDDSAILSSLLRNAGADVFELPLLSLCATNQEQIAERLSRSSENDLLVVTSANALKLHDISPVVARRWSVAAIGQKTAKAALELGMDVVFAGSGEESGRFAHALISFLDISSRQWVPVLLRGAAATRDLEEVLTAKGISFETLIAYESRADAKIPALVAALQKKLTTNNTSVKTILVFTSSLGVQHFTDEVVTSHYAPAILKLPCVVIGAKTAQTCGERGFEAVHVAAEPSDAAVVAACVNVLSAAKNGAF